MLEVQNLTITIGDKRFVDNLSFTVGEGDKLAIIGEEGNGKSTLIKAIACPDEIKDYAKVSGLVVLRGQTIGYLSQMMDSGWHDQSVHEFFIKASPNDAEDYEKYGDMGRINSLISKFGLSHVFQGERTIGELSGGEKVKLGLIKVLDNDPDILLLDEPTNDLDIQTLEWLENFILDTKKPIVYISHDESLLEKTANAILHIEQLKKKTECKCTFVRMGYSDYIQKRARDIDKQTQVAINERAQAAAQMERWRQIYSRVNSDLNSISRSDPSGGRLLKKKMQSVKAQQKRFEREQSELTEIPDQEEAIYLDFGGSQIPKGKSVCHINLDKLVAGGRVLARNIKLDIVGPQKMTIIGKNGVGKTTLIKHIYKALKDRPDLRCGYMPQNYDDFLSGYTSVLDYVAENASSKDELTQIRTFLGCLKFTSEEVLGDISGLSGGQKAKLYLARLMASKNNVLILDEPTRNLSPLSNPVIRAALKVFNGAIISVSHDRKYISAVSDVVLEMSENGLMECTEKFKG